MSKKPTTAELTQSNKELLQGIASDPEQWKAYLETMAMFTGRDRRRLASGGYEALDNLSALNCASVVASGGGKRAGCELMTERDWKKLYPDASAAEGAVGIPVVKASSTGKNLWVDYLLPPESMTGLPEGRYHNIPAKIDLEDDVDAECFEAAVSGLHVYRSRLDDEGKRVFENGKPVRDAVSVGLDELDSNTAFVVKTHYGLPVGEGEEPACPPMTMVADVAALKAYCDSVKSDAASIVGQMDRAFRAKRNEIQGITVGEGTVERATEAVQASNPRHEQEASAPRPVRSEAAGVEPEPRRQDPFLAYGRSPDEVGHAARSAASRGVEDLGASGPAMSV